MLHPTLQRIIDESYHSFFLIAGPCVVESYDICALVAEKLATISAARDIPFIFKASFKKANRTRIDSFTGIGDEKAINILQRIKEDFDIAITTDVHSISDIELIREVIDLIQIPAFLCRQTDLLLAAGGSGLPVNIKKGQFATAGTMAYAVEKVEQGQSARSSTAKSSIFLTERGTMHGYHDLIVDPRSIAKMSDYATTIIDITHANQKPNQGAGVTAGSSDDALLLGKVGLVAGARGVFLEAHPDPPSALSDGATMIALSEVSDIIGICHKISEAVHK